MHKLLKPFSLWAVMAPDTGGGSGSASGEGDGDKGQGDGDKTPPSGQDGKGQDGKARGETEVEKKDPPAKSQAELEAELARTAKALKEANKEAETRRLRLEELEKAETERKKAAMSETERLAAEKKEAEDKLSAAERRAAEAETKRQEAILRGAVIARAAGRFADPEAVMRLADLSEVKVNEAGEVEGIDKALEALATKSPWALLPKDKQRPGLGATNGGQATGGRTDDERRGIYFNGNARAGGLFEPRADGVKVGKG
jgi:hypothetical protein